MNIKFIPIDISEKETVLNLFKAAAVRIAKMEIDHWQYWHNPPKEKVEWVEAGIRKGEFHFIRNGDSNTLGMVRILKEDLLYWGKQKEKAFYIHSLVIKDQYEGKGMGQMVIKEIEKQAMEKACKYLRLDADAKNPKLCAYYENQGFKRVGLKELSLSSYCLYQKELRN